MAIANIDATDDGDNEVIAAVPGERIVIEGFVMSASATNVVQFKDGASTVMASFRMSASMSHDWPTRPNRSLFVLTVGNAFIVNTSAGQDVLGFVEYHMEK